MCGRYASFTDAQSLADDLALAEVAEDARLLGPRWNVAPTDDVRIVVEKPRRERLDDGRTVAGEITRSLQRARWGLVPSWAKDPGIGSRMINARSETLLDKPAFARPLAVRRCLVPADGYYEWRRLEAPPGTRKVPKQPYWIHPADDGVAAFAGLYEFWRDPGRSDDDPDRWLVSATIVTTAAAGGLERIHDRMPVTLPPATWDVWLDPAVGAEEAATLLTTAAPAMSTRPVRSRVGNVRHDDASLLETDAEPLDPDLVLL
ncbi:SOS response-associated peptidase [Isoptericola halotolerans]|uniref:Abasic site processing protein n=1 Tax=Isoptericola halotolerans TaxID=300560 RepID=A0ABX2A137_9MICO|nr:SOS response-associated peptidase [Isoptericola halotolerans]NOV96562.1 putative SOS response-associated peptidase YedK [Isoptericola halotolerans]